MQPAQETAEQRAARRAALVEDHRRGAPQPERAVERSRGGGRDARPEPLETRD